MSVDAPARNCPYRDADGRLRFSTYQTELFDVLGYPIRRDGKLFVAARSYVASEYADGWMTNYPIRDKDDNRLFAVQPTGVAMADCWPDEITIVLLGWVGTTEGTYPTGSVIKILDLGDSGTFHTLSKVSFASDVTHTYVLYRKTFTGTAHITNPGDMYDDVEPGGIEYSISVDVVFGFKDGGVTGSFSNASIEPYSVTEPLSVFNLDIIVNSLATPDNPGSAATLLTNMQFTSSKLCQPIPEAGSFSSFAEYNDGFFEDQSPCNGAIQGLSWNGIIEFYLEDLTCTDLLDYLIDQDVTILYPSGVWIDVGGGIYWNPTAVQCNFIGASYA